MSEIKHIVENMQSIFAESQYPREFMEKYDLMECLCGHNGRETFLIREKENGETAVAKCYDLSRFPLQPHPELLQDIFYPGLPRYLGQYQNDQVLCVVREYIEGEPLNDYARDRQLTLEQILLMGEQLCGILTVLHGHQPMIIHRDIKPENIIVKPDGTLALIDFDISRAYREGGGSDTVYFGTKGYAPPEQYGFGQTDNRADLYALGILLRWLITGNEKENPNVTVDGRLERIIGKCTAFSPEDRYDSADQVRRALRKVREGRSAAGLRRWALRAAALLGALCCGFLLGRLTDLLRPAPGVAFSEPLIERAARLQIGKETGALSGEELGRVTRIYIYGSEAYADAEAFYLQRVDGHEEGPIRTLEDLKNLPNLEEVHIIRQGNVDISGLAGLNRVTTVDLKHMRISGVEPIACLSRLRHAILFDCGLGEVTGLEDCPLLETLDVGLNHLTGLEQVGSHPRLKSLGLMWLNMKNVNDIAERMPRLRAITLQHGSIWDLSGLSTLPELETVSVLPSQLQEVSEALKGTDVEIRVTDN